MSTRLYCPLFLWGKKNTWNVRISLHYIKNSNYFSDGFVPKVCDFTTVIMWITRLPTVSKFSWLIFRCFVLFYYLFVFCFDLFLCLFEFFLTQANMRKQYLKDKRQRFIWFVAQLACCRHMVKPTFHTVLSWSDLQILVACVAHRKQNIPLWWHHCLVQRSHRRQH